MRYLIAAAIFLGACSTGSLEPSATGDLDPQFQKVVQDGMGGGNGGGGTSGGGACEYPRHWSPECETKAVKAGVATGTTILTCAGGLSIPCATGAGASGTAWVDYHNTPGSDGLPYTTYPDYNPHTHTGCDFGCMTRNDPPFNTVPGSDGGYGYGHW